MEKKINWAGVAAVVVLFLAFWDPVVASVLAVIALAALAITRNKIVEDKGNKQSGKNDL